MKLLRFLICVLLVLTTSGLAFAADSKGKRIDVAPVDVPEKAVVQPTPEEIHADSAPGQTCNSCHGPNSQDAEKKPLNHFLTTKDCGTCHFNKSWFSLRIYTHTNGRYQAMLRNPTRPNPNPDPQDCANCHFSNNEFLAK